MTKRKKTNIKTPTAFSAETYKTERSAVAVFMHWMREIITNKGIELGMPDVETSADDRKMPDTIIYESPRGKRVLCVIEAKLPAFDIFDEKQIKEPARAKATARRAKYFAVTNFKRLLWFNTEKVNALLPEEEQIVEKYALSEITDINELEQTRFSSPIKRELENFLRKLAAVHTGKEPEPKLAIDDFLVFRLHEKINALSVYYRRIIDDQCHKTPSFAKNLGLWFYSQGWDFNWQPQDFDKAARQTAYLLVNKIIFYNLLQAKRPRDLDPLDIPETRTKGARLRADLKACFDDVLKIDYETIFTTDFIDTLAFPDSDEVVSEIKELIVVLKRYNFSSLGFDIIGRIFERLIPEEERHNLGQYFTSPDVVDLILGFCLQHENDMILDPSCGAGTFLVRAYQHKKLLNQRLPHNKILDTLWGCDIAKFPAHLSTINLAVNDLGVDRNYPNIIHEDFFKLLVGDRGFEAPRAWRKARASTLGVEEREIICPARFDAVVGNPPYTRQEEISETGVDKQNLIENALEHSGAKSAKISKRAGIHAYFFVHGTKFLREGGVFGFIVSNSWLDADFGKGLQAFFLENYKITAIIESKVERWFAEADINTCIVILEKCADEKARGENLVRFVQMKKPLRRFIPPAQDIWEKRVERRNAIDSLKKTILAHNDFYENEDLKIFPIRQKLLWDEGYDGENKKYEGAKWGKYIRANGIYFNVMEKGKGKLVHLAEVADICRGFTTGADPWFYVSNITATTEHDYVNRMFRSSGYEGKLSDLILVQSGDGTKWLVENKYVFPVIRNPDKYSSIFIDVNEIKDFVVIIREPRKKLKGSLVEKYIRHGETKQYKMGKEKVSVPSKTDTCSNRKYWYQLPEISPSRILWQKAFYTSFRHNLTNKVVFANQRFYHLYPLKKMDVETIAASLNSTLIPFHLELQRAALGLGAGEATVEETSRIMIVAPNALQASTKRKLVKTLNKLGRREIGSIFDELGAASPEETALEKVRSDRRELDKIIMGEILGLDDEEQLDVYRAVIDLVKSRLTKAKSLNNNKKANEDGELDAITDTIVERLKTVNRR
ncbi:MAG: N-6 DNA methylase [bacterium]